MDRDRTSLLRQSLAVLRIGISASRANLTPTVVALIGIVCAVGALVAMLSMAAGVRETALSGARSDRAVVVARDAESAGASRLPANDVRILGDLPGIERGADGEPHVVAEALLRSFTRRQSDNARIEREVRGVLGDLYGVYPELRVTSGRKYRTGHNEVMVGDALRLADDELRPGNSIRYFGVDLTIVGSYVSPGVRNSHIVGDAVQLLSLAPRGDYNQVTVVLEHPSAFDVLSRAVAETTSLDVTVWPERTYLESSVRPVFELLDVMGYLIGAVMAIGATVGAANATYAAMDVRRHQLATLRAVGYRDDAIVAAMALESALLAMAGASIAVVLARLIFDGMGATPLGSPITLAVTPSVAGIAFAWALGIGLAGACLPVSQVTRTTVADALRSP